MTSALVRQPLAPHETMNETLITAQWWQALGTKEWTQVSWNELRTTFTQAPWSKLWSYTLPRQEMASMGSLGGAAYQILLQSKLVITALMILRCKEDEWVSNLGSVWIFVGAKHSWLYERLVGERHFHSFSVLMVVDGCFSARSFGRVALRWLL